MFRIMDSIHVQALVHDKIVILVVILDREIMPFIVER